MERERERERRERERERKRRDDKDGGEVQEKGKVPSFYDSLIAQASSTLLTMNEFQSYFRYAYRHGFLSSSISTFVYLRYSLLNEVIYTSCLERCAPTIQKRGNSSLLYHTLRVADVDR